MKYRGIKLLGILALSMMSIVGCSTQKSEEVAGIEQQLVVIQEENQILQESVNQLQEKVDQLTTENKSLVLEMEQLTKQEYFLYSRDIDSWEVIEEGRVKIDKNLGIKEKVQQLANELSKNLFDGLIIEVEEIKKVNGEAIAFINLKEVEGSEVTWMQDYFQGSAGAMITKTKLEETLLQRDNPIDWIGGIKLVYEGEDLFIDHIVLDSIVYRK